MERYWCLQYLIQEGFLEENKQEIHATVWRENLVRLDNIPYMTKVYGLPELKPGTRVSLLVQEVDTLMIDLRTKFVKVLEEATAPVDFDDADLIVEALDDLEPEKLDLNATDSNAAVSAILDDTVEAEAS
jgi:exoribonuclease-2